jgi:hypothetical protein
LPAAAFGALTEAILIHRRKLTESFYGLVSTSTGKSSFPLLQNVPSISVYGEKREIFHLARRFLHLFFKKGGVLAVVFGRESALGCEDHAEGLEEADFLRGDGCHQAVTLPSHNRNLYF